VVATAGDIDHIAYFNYTDYEHNALRMVRLGVSGLWQPARWVALVGEVRSENLGKLDAYAGYVRIRPWRDHALDIQAGRIPPTFGAFSRRVYGTDNPFIGYPLAYQYLTSLRPNAVPATADDLFRMRARGWRSSFPVGSSVAEPGVPLVTAFRWDLGAQVRWASGPFEAAASVTNGTLSSPRLSDDNAGKQISARAAVSPIVGLRLGASVARGPWIARSVPQPDGTHRPQIVIGADAEYSRDHWLIRSEMIRSQWTLPYPVTPDGRRTVGALAGWVEGSYRFTPRVFGALRVDRLGFSRIQGTLFGAVPTAWDAPVQRVETSVGYYFQRNIVGRLGVQANHREGGRVRHRTYFAGQISYWF
jgi:hypothetical protein